MTWNDNNNQQIITYIKVREQWKDALRLKSSALSSIINGLFRFGTFLAYWAVEKYFLKDLIDSLYQQYPNYKYVFWLSLGFGLWGIVDSGIGMFRYFSASSHAEQLRNKVEELEREL